MVPFAEAPAAEKPVTPTPPTFNPAHCFGVVREATKTDPTPNTIHLLVDETRGPFAPGKAKAPKLADAVNRRAADGADILSDDYATLIAPLDLAEATIQGKSVSHFYNVTVYPRRDLVLAREALAKRLRARAAAFSPGELKTVKDATKAFGEPTDREVWAGRMAKHALAEGEGDAYWWGQVGVVAAKDGTITHIVIRHPKK